MGSTEILLFILGFILGCGAVWLLRQKEIDSVNVNQEQLRNAFGDLSNEALIKNQKNSWNLLKTNLLLFLANQMNNWVRRRS